MSGFRIRDAGRIDFPRILELNQESEAVLSPLDEVRLIALDQLADYHRVVAIEGLVVAFCLALQEGRAYDSPNYQWFESRLDDFLYVDRIVVARLYQGRRLGAMLYDDLFSFAVKKGVGSVTCEYDIDPPNPGSQRFHERYGFEEVGTQSVAAGKKLVSLQRADPRRLRRRFLG